MSYIEQVEKVEQLVEVLKLGHPEKNEELLRLHAWKLLRLWEDIK